VTQINVTEGVSGSPPVSRGRNHHHERAFIALGSTHQEIVAAGPETTVIVAAVLVRPFPAPARCSIPVPLLPAALPRSVAVPVHRLIDVLRSTGKARSWDIVICGPVTPSI
jgi:hypothetical protein